ncbi:hypothetical protein PS914_03222 [Pseudomonas fluorescens]|uniref:hypothetical protein n=1 Tax=Pseudomonas fluorescens TaxID=294 RepID=UPI001241BBB1|nr:hypothetical protein [Pseudomonas fluorescens]VVP92049.1 hypothetical protein PS914_03222 [Pseudomonas fluorescens]
MRSLSEILTACSRWFRKYFGLLVLTFLLLVQHSCTTQQIETVKQEADYKIAQQALLSRQQLQRYQQETSTVLRDVSRAQVNIGKVKSTTINDHSRTEIGNINVKVEAPNYGTQTRKEPASIMYKPKPNTEKPSEAKP